MKKSYCLSSINKRVHVIINPESSGGKTKKKVPFIMDSLKKYLGNSYSCFITRKPYDATVSARSAILDGNELVIAVGGDGTLQETVNGFFENGDLINPACSLGIINCGTGQGFATSIKHPNSFSGQLDILFSGQDKQIDLGRISYISKSGEKGERYFINECQAGIGGIVVEKTTGLRKVFGGTISYGLSSLNALFKFPNLEMRIEIDGKQLIEGKFIGVIVANGNFMAGGMQLTPGAKVDDGIFDILLMREQSVFSRLNNFPKIYTGRHLTSEKFTLLKGKNISITSKEEILAEADGELLGKVPCRIDILPSIINLKIARLKKGSVEGLKK